MMLWYGGGGWSFWEVGLMWVGMIAFWALIIWAVYALVSTAFHRGSANDRRDDARRILDERLAKGEIDSEEYRRIVDELSGKPRSDTHAGGAR
ncbi:MAG TPA: hypothetical protein VHB02_18565 [Acidimicrobiales bacterium]|nr:hypothetical protein [Acidimicrobiales bacterium]